MAAKKFDLGDALADALKVSGSDTETLQQIDINLLDSDARNFYTLDGIDELAGNIQLIGLQQPIRVRPNPDMPGRYFIVSGHRRRAALWTLYEEQPEKWKYVPCIVEADAVSPAMQELRLIYANADTRKMNDADLAKQAERVQTLLYQLKEEGVEFPGRMRDHVAEACKVSAAKLATLKVIRENLAEELQPRFANGTLPTETAYQLARMPAELQIRLSKACIGLTSNEAARIANAVKNGATYDCALTCPDGKSCSHGDAFLRHDVREYDVCKGEKCCLNCDNASCDWYPCKNACSKAKDLRSKNHKKEQEKKVKRDRAEQAKRDKKIKANAQRLMKAIDAAGLGDDETLSCDYTAYKVSTIRQAAEEPLDPGRGYQCEDRFTLRWANDLIQASKKLRCSTDYLLGLSDELTPAGVPAAAVPVWQTGKPPKTGLYVGKFLGDGMSIPVIEVCRYSSLVECWMFQRGDYIIDMPCVGWVGLPEDKEKDDEEDDDE